MVKLTMEPVTRIEGHAKITVRLDDAGNVEETRLHVMEFRGFEKFLTGRPVEELPRLVPRICGICDVQHHLAAAKAVDQIFGFDDYEILPAAYRMREIMNWGSYMHSHALHFYFLAAPDLIIPNGTRKTRNVFQVIKDMPEIALQAINIRRNGLEMVRKIGGRPIHPTSSTPGGISTELDADTQKDLLERAKQNVELAQATLDLAIPVFEENIDLIAECVLMYTFSRLVKVERTVEDVVYRMIRYAEDNFSDESLSLATLSADLGYNAKYLSHRFKEQTGEGFTTFLNNLRIKNALFLFDHGVNAVKNVARLCGFFDPLYFSKVFKEKTGMSPMQASWAATSVS